MDTLIQALVVVLVYIVGNTEAVTLGLPLLCLALASLLLTVYFGMEIYDEFTNSTSSDSSVSIHG
jgi:hypothetical protein